MTARLAALDDALNPPSKPTRLRRRRQRPPALRHRRLAATRLRHLERPRTGPLLRSSPGIRL